ncbi:GNAT family N-acetyltransferase [Gilvimarinus sp. F26214L]|uniref:GNAT family N-acetyltransferase n=1 Tax=Gilvimarinus sp. DZF01 TaxID=3461371 RepID=UPI0040458966
MEFREIAFGTREYQDARQLREQILRAPLGKTLSAEDLQGESEQLHFGLFDGQELLACVLIKPLPDGCGKLRQMAVTPARQGQGLGAILVRATEEQVRKRGYHRITLAARATAAGFYQKLGYRIVSDAYLELGVEHLTMEKTLEP